MKLRSIFKPLAYLVLCSGGFFGFWSSAYCGIDEALTAAEKGDFLDAYTQFKALAEQGDAEAQYNLAVLLKNGSGVMQNPTEAAVWFRKAADQGLAEAQYNLGHMYDNGVGVTQSYEYAAVWYKKAAMQGNARAQTNLGVLFANGQGVSQDIIKAYVWFNLAASQGIGAAFENREILAKEMTPEMLENVRDLSKQYFDQYVEPYQKQPVKAFQHKPYQDKKDKK